MKAMTTFVFLLLISGSVIAQKGDNKDKYDDQFESSKIAYISKALDLTPQESKAFWPVYEKFEARFDALKKKGRKYTSKELKEMSKAEAESYIADMIEREQNKYETKKEYLKTMLTILPPEKVSILYVVEGEFRRELIQQMKKRRGHKDD